MFKEIISQAITPADLTECICEGRYGLVTNSWDDLEVANP